LLTSYISWLFISSTQTASSTYVDLKEQILWHGCWFYCTASLAIAPFQNRAHALYNRKL